MRCPDCCKFVGLETQDPDGQADFTVETPRIDDLPDGQVPEQDAVTMTWEGTVARNCVECGTELKSGSYTIEELIEFPSPHPGGEGHEIHVEFDDALANEGGGGRYKKNLIAVEVGYQITCECGMELGTGTMSDSLAAGEFEESC